MELSTFLNHPVTQGAVSELIDNRPNAADRGYAGAEYLPEVNMDVTEYKRTVTVLLPSIIARDVAPLSTGRFGSGVKRQSVGGGLIDSAAHMHYDGEEFEMFLALIKDLPGETVRASMPAVAQYLRLTDSHLLTPLDMNKERKRWTLMGTGRAWYENNRQDDFKLPPVLNVFDAGQTQVVTQASGKSIYGGADADFFEDYRAQVDAAQAAGYPITEAVMHSRTRQQILNLPSTKNALGATTLNVVTGGQVEVQMQQGAATVDAFNAALVARDLPPVRVYDGYFTDMVHDIDDPAGAPGTYVSRSYVPVGRVILIPRADVSLDFMPAEPTMPQRILTPFTSQRRVGIHVIGRPTGQSNGPRTYVFGPNYHPGVNPNLDGDSLVSHMPFLHVPAGFRILEYQQA